MTVMHNSLVKFYHSNNIPFSAFVDELSLIDKRYILLYYDVSTIPENRYNFGLDLKSKEDCKFVLSIIKKWNCKLDKVIKLIKI
jgi:hypothetical protein